VIYRECGIKTVKGLKGMVHWPNATDLSVFYEDPQVLKTAGDASDLLVQSITYDPCKPLLSVPRAVYNLDPAWSTCTAGISGLWDPPRVLQPASGPLSPDPTTTPQAQTILTSSAAPASAVAHTTPTATTSAGPAPKPSQVIPASSSSRSNAGPGSTAEPGANRDSAIIPKQDPSQDPGFISDSTTSTHSEPDIPKNGGLQSLSKKPTELQSQNGGPPTANLDSPAPPSSPITGSHTALGLPSKGLSVNGAILTAGSAPVTLDNIPVSVATAYAGVGTSRPALANIPSDIPSFNSHQIEVASDGRVIAAGATLSQGGSGVTISGTEASLGGSGLVIGTSTFAIRSSTPAIAPTLPSIGGQQVSLGSNGLIIGTSTMAVPAPASVSALPLVGGQKVQVAPDSNVIIGGTTLSHGGSAATVAGTAVSLGADGFIIGTSTFVVPTPASASTLPLVGGQAVQVAPSGNVVVAGTAISPGKAGAIISGTPVSLGPNGLIIGHSTFTVAVSPVAPTLPLIGGQRIHPAADGGFVVASTTLQPGAPGTVVSGTSVSLGSQGLVIGSSTYAPPKQQSAAVYTIGGETLIAAPSSAVLVAGQTLSIGGPAVTISKTVTSLGSAGLVVGSKTYNIPTYFNEAPSLITFGIGGTAATSALANSSVVAFTAQAGRGSGVWNKHTFFLSAVVAAGFGVLAFGL
jgi:hypothetical protein